MKVWHEAIIAMAPVLARRVGADLQLLQVSRRSPVSGAAQPQEVSASALMPAPLEDCRTAVEGDACYEEVMYAMQGIVEHPEWFSALTTSSTFEDIQRHLHGVDRLSKVCPDPCAAQAPARLPAPEDCFTSVEGDPCYEEVTYAMQGVVDHPEWFSPLTKSSSFEDFQRHLHSVAWLASVCPVPCPAQAREEAAAEGCGAPVEGDECYAEVMDAMRTGVVRHPDRYGNLTRSSSFEDFQRQLHSVFQVCPEPCSAQSPRRPA